MNAVIQSKFNKARIGIIGGGVAGATVALQLGEIGLDVTLFEKGPSLVNGPPICHLHAGGNLYREISEQQCLTLVICHPILFCCQLSSLHCVQLNQAQSRGFYFLSLSMVSCWFAA